MTFFFSLVSSPPCPQTTALIPPIGYKFNYTHTWEPRHELTRTSVHRNILARKLRQSLRGRLKHFVFSPCERHDDKAAGRKLACAKIFEEWCRAGG